MGKEEYFDMTAENDVASLIGSPLTNLERDRLYTENLEDGRKPIKLRGERRCSEMNSKRLDEEVTYLLDKVS